MYGSLGIESDYVNDTFQRWSFLGTSAYMYRKLRSIYLHREKLSKKGDTPTNMYNAVYLSPSNRKSPYMSEYLLYDCPN